MERQISKLKAYTSLFTPTVAGLILYVSLAGMIIVLNQFEIIQNYLQIPHDVQLGRIVVGWADSLLSSTIGESSTETLIVGLFWAVVGLVVYMFLRGLALLAVELDDDLNARSFVWPKGSDRTRPLRIFMEQAAFRVVAVIGLILVVFGPVASVLRGPIFVDFLGSNKILQFVVWFLASVVIWHIVVILVRLMILRARIFG